MVHDCRPRGARQAAPSVAVIETLFASILPRRGRQRREAIAALIERMDDAAWAALREASRCDRRFDAVLRGVLRDALGTVG